MSKKVLFLATVVSILLVCNVKAEVEVVDVNWDGGGDGHSWGDPYNWNPNIVPEEDNFAVRIDGGSSGVHLWLFEGTTIHSLTIDGGVRITSFGAFYAVQFLENNGTLYAYAGALAIASEGPLLNTGTLTNTAVSSLHIKPVEDVNNFGTIEVNAGGGVAFDCNLVNEPNAVIKLLGGTLAAAKITQKAGATFQGFGGITGDVIIDPNGIIRLTGPTNIVGDVTIENNAVLEISDGQALITGHTTCNGTIHIKGGNIIPQGGLSGNCKIIISDMVTYNNTEDFYLEGTSNFKNVAVLADTWLWQTEWY